MGEVAKYCNEHVCVSVCLSVCPQACLRNHMRNVYQIFVHVAYHRGLVLLRRIDEIPTILDQFLPNFHRMVGIWS